MRDVRPQLVSKTSTSLTSWSRPTCMATLYPTWCALLCCHGLGFRLMTAPLTLHASLSLTAPLCMLCFHPWCVLLP